MLGSHLEPVGTGRFSSGSAEYGGHAVRIFEIGSNVVLDFDIMISAKIAECADSGRHSKDPLKQIKIVRALVEQHSPSLAFPGSSPIAGLIVGFCSEPVGNSPVYAPDRPQFARFYQPTELQKVRVRTLIEHAGKDLTRAPVSGNQAFGIGFVDGDRLFDKQMTTRLKRLNPDGSVRVVRRGNQDGIRLGREQEIFRRMKSFGGRKTLRAFGLRVTDRGKLAPWDFALHDALRMYAAHGAN